MISLEQPGEHFQRDSKITHSESSVVLETAQIVVPNGGMLSVYLFDRADTTKGRR
jgi:hypothetical protein